MLRTVDLYESVITEMEDMAAFLDAGAYSARAAHTRQVARDHRVTLLLHRASADTAQEILARILRDQGG